MRRPLLERIIHALGHWSPYFTLRRDVVGRERLTPLQKCTTAIRQLAYGTPADALVEYLKIGEKTALDCLKLFTEGVISIFGDEYTRRPNTEDVQRLLDVGESRGFPGMLGSLDCMHWCWEKCPIAWKGQFTHGDKGVPTLILWIWHAFFGVPGCNNDINVLNQSTLFIEQLSGHNEKEYQHGYYLVDGIYSEWAAFIKSIPMAQTEKHKLFARHQEGIRKDVEHAFGVLQSRWSILCHPARLYARGDIKNVMTACIIMHNMIVEDEKEEAGNILDMNLEAGTSIIFPSVFDHDVRPAFADVLERYAIIRHCPTHQKTKG
ncbi:uncharacterized protein [Aegilops tauschii subsp. strangulata]|uniref:DDE Tnp4 domain-containing protein n=1 Tax=Aegilops tauschii subsp. strangulata TaxID=200361 RepID=A0A453HL47_AEGTS|nr:uncharacterized protein LOC123493516 [Aegilops tauschii subsp. strangulata]